MKIEILEDRPHSDFPEGLLFDAIENYVEHSNFPKNIVAKKLELSERAIRASIKETEVLIDRGSKSIEQLMESSQRLNVKCNNLLRSLRNNFSFS